MAMITCPECGKAVSDKAKMCPNCAYPLEEIVNFGKIKIKLGAQSNGFNSKQKVTISTRDGKVLWEGISGQIVELNITTSTYIIVKYHLSWSANLFGGTTEGTIDPNKWSKYNVSAIKGPFGNVVINLHGVDVLDAD